MAKKKGRRKLKPQQLNLTRLTIPGAGENVGEPGLLSHGRQEPDTHGHSGKWRGGFSQSEAYTFRVPRECSPQLHSSRSSTGNLKNVRPPTGRSTRHVGSTLPCTSTGSTSAPQTHHTQVKTAAVRNLTQGSVDVTFPEKQSYSD